MTSLTYLSHWYSWLWPGQERSVPTAPKPYGLRVVLVYRSRIMEEKIPFFLSFSFSSFPPFSPPFSLPSFLPSSFPSSLPFCLSPFLPSLFPFLSFSPLQLKVPNFSLSILSYGFSILREHRFAMCFSKAGACCHLSFEHEGVSLCSSLYETLT